MARGLNDYLRQRWLDRIQTVNILAIARRVSKLEERMSALGDYLREFRSEVEAQTTSIGDRIADLEARLSSGDQAAVDEARTELTGIVDELRAMGSGAGNDPLPAPPSDVPTDEIGTGGEPV